MTVCRSCDVIGVTGKVPAVGLSISSGDDAYLSCGDVIRDERGHGRISSGISPDNMGVS